MCPNEDINIAIIEHYYDEKTYNNNTEIICSFNPITTGLLRVLVAPSFISERQMIKTSNLVQL